MPIFDLTHFEKLFAPFEGKRVVFVPLNGWAGDHLIHLATELMFDRFGIEFDKVLPAELTPESVGHYDELVVSGGGNMGGNFYKSPYEARQRIIEFDIPITVFPQSFIQNREDLSPYKKIYVREKASRKLNPDLQLMPDLALGYIGPVPKTRAVCSTGVFLRGDVEQCFQHDPLSLGDPAWLSSTVNELFDLACRFEHIVTDRLHFSIAALLAGREVTLLPNSYFKNRSIYDTWLRDLCNWRDDLSGLDYDKNGAERRLYQRLAGAPSSVFDWAAVPIPKKGYFIEPKGENYLLIHVDGGGSGSLECNETALMVWQLCDGERSIDQIAQLLIDAYPDNCALVARDVQSNVRTFLGRGAIDLDQIDEKPRIVKKTSDRRHRQKVFRLDVSEPTVVDRRVRCKALLNNVELWFDLEARHKAWINPVADPFVLISLMAAMSAKARLKVEGAPVSAGLLENLEEFQRAWSCWRDNLFPVAVDASTTPGESRQGKPAICTFSGGVDSCYTVYRYLVNPDRKWIPPVEGALMIQGFDSEVDEEKKFRHSFRNGRKLLAGLPVELVSVRTNVKKHLGHWLDRHGLLLGAALTLFGRKFGTGIIANTSPYDMLLPLGSNPITDPLMGSDAFNVFHHGGEVSRFEKIRAMLDWPPLQDHLRVCWQQGRPGKLNCGECLSCMLASLSFRCLGRSPGCLPDLKDPGVLTQVLGAAKFGRIDWYDMKCIVKEAEARGLTEANWLQPVKSRLASMQ